MRKNIFAVAALLGVALLQGCAATAPSYRSNYSEARNIASVGGLDLGIEDRDISKSEDPWTGPGISLGDLVAIANVGVGALEGGVLGMGGVGSAAFNTAHGVWATSKDDHWSQNYFFAYIPKSYNPELTSPTQVREYLDNKLVRTSVAILEDHGFEMVPVLDKKIHYEAPVHRWLLVNDKYSCSEEKANCVFTVYTVNHKQVNTAINPSFLGNKKQEESWKFFRGPNKGKSTIDITSFDTSSIIPELEFYQELSTKMPNWFNLYIAPARATTERYDQGYLPYNVIVRNGETLKFIRP
ncbi:hypothetical protein ACH42_02860 [Endozoicomonas sp. (ex Bugula neritina AB1)]|nr:hypothetical protein ACH42_02860 [Endozoicomonas sp. (ex Bugula neritina AB1)]